MNGSYVLTAAGRIEMEDRKINILGITYTVKEVDCVDKYAGVSILPRLATGISNNNQYIAVIHIMKMHFIQLLLRHE